MTEKLVNCTKEIWFDGRNVPLEKTDVWSYINNSAINKIVVTFEQRCTGNYPVRTEYITQISSADDLEKLEKNDTVLSDNHELLDLARAKGFKTCISLNINDRDALESSWYEALNFNYMLVDFNLPTNIPLELIIARLQHRTTVVLKRVCSCEDMKVVFGVMEQGSDGVLVDSSDISELSEINSFILKKSTNSIVLQPMKVNRICHIGMGMRACIDTTGLMTQDEGMLVGSTSNGGVFVCSETHYLPYMNLRPFRVNAGAVHSYVWMPENAAEYITDLTVGSKVLCINTKGETRTLTVGRVKTEMRPLLLIAGEVAGCELNVVVQDDWHIRVMGADGKPRNATAIEPGDELLAYICEPGRHVGIKVDETIIER